jgi:hypothetical protein
MCRAEFNPYLARIGMPLWGRSGLDVVTRTLGMARSGAERWRKS